MVTACQTITVPAPVGTTYAAADGSTPVGTVVCEGGYTYTIAGWNSSLHKYQLHMAGTSSGSDIYVAYNFITIGTC